MKADDASRISARRAAICLPVTSPTAACLFDTGQGAHGRPQRQRPRSSLSCCDALIRVRRSRGNRRSLATRAPDFRDKLVSQDGESSPGNFIRTGTPLDEAMHRPHREVESGQGCKDVASACHDAACTLQYDGRRDCLPTRRPSIPPAGRQYLEIRWYETGCGEVPAGRAAPIEPGRTEASGGRSCYELRSGHVPGPYAELRKPWRPASCTARWGTTSPGAADSCVASAPVSGNTFDRALSPLSRCATQLAVVADGRVAARREMPVAAPSRRPVRIQTSRQSHFLPELRKL
jgi:hypothetical protein